MTPKETFMLIWGIALLISVIVMWILVILKKNDNK
jgi:type II secretory pathway component PulM